MMARWVQRCTRNPARHTCPFSFNSIRSMIWAAPAGAQPADCFLGAPIGSPEAGRCDADPVLVARVAPSRHDPRRSGFRGHRQFARPSSENSEFCLPSPFVIQLFPYVLKQKICINGGR